MALGVAAQNQPEVEEDNSGTTLQDAIDDVSLYPFELLVYDFSTTDFLWVTNRGLQDLLDYYRALDTGYRF